MKRAPWIVFGAALLIRLVVAASMDKLPLAQTPQYDSLEYLTWARQLAGGDFTWPVAPPHGPGYPFFLAAILAVSGGSLFAARVAQSILGALTCLLVARAAATWFSRRAGAAAGALLALYAPLIWIDVSILAEGLLIFLLAAALWAMATRRHPALIGLLLGLGAIVRPTAVLFLPLFLFAAAKSWRLRLAMIAATCAVIAPVTIANARTSHAFLPVQAYGGMNVYLGDSPFRDGLASARPGGEWDALEAAAARHGAAGPLAEDRWFVRQTRAEIAAHPARFARLLALKIVRTLQNDEIRDTHSFYFFATEIPLLRFLLPFAVLAGLAAAGGVMVRARSAGAAIVWTFIALAIVSCAALVVGARYRLPIVLGLAALGGVAVDCLVENWRRAVPLAAGVAVALLTLVWRHPPSHNVAEELALTADSLMKQDRNADAEQTAREAIEADPHSALAWDTLGAVLAARGDRGGAAPAFAKAVALNPQFARAHLHRGMLASDPNEFRRALAIDPRNAVAAEGLARSLLQANDLPAAAEAYKRLIATQPESAEALLQLARIEGALNRPAEGLAYAQRGAALADPSGDNWLLVALLATHAGNFAAAEEALQRAQSLSGRTPQVLFSWSVLRFEQGRLAEAEQLLDEIERASPGIPDVQALRARIARAAATH